MGKFRVLVWCDVCCDDAEGCFGGGREFIGSAFETRADAEKAGAEYCCSLPYSFIVEEDDDAG